MGKVQKTVLITDIDNTLFDWAEMWVQSFSAMLNVLLKETNIPREVLISEIKEVHQKYGTSEYVFLLQELPCLKRESGKINPIEKYKGAIEAYRIARNESLTLYPTVENTLKKVKAQGALIIGYTESMAFYSNYRIRKLELDSLIDVLYSPADHNLPENLDVDKLRYYPKENYEFKHTIHKHTPIDELKPNPALLLDIIKDLKAYPEECVYIGDNLYKDVKMAQEAGISDIHALYGRAFHRPEYQLLVEVTHWTDDQVQREKLLPKTGEVSPSFICEKNIAQIFDFFDFTPFKGEM